LEISASRGLAIRRGPKLEDINGVGLTTNKDVRFVSIVMLSSAMSNSFLRQVMKCISSAHDVDSILLHCHHLKSALFTSEIQATALYSGQRKRSQSSSDSWNTETNCDDCDGMPGTLKRLYHSLCLLPSLRCLGHNYN